MESSDRTNPIGRALKATRAERDRSTAAAVLAHPVRVRVLEVLNERDMSPIEYCREGLAPAGMDVSHVAYHFRELAEFGCLTVVEENKRRGSIEHVYRGIGRAYFSDADWSGVSPEDRPRITRTVIQGLLARIEGALMTETFESREDRHLTWIAMRLDEQGWKEMVTALGAAFGEVEQIRNDAERRLAESGEDPIASTCAILGFPSPSAPDGPPPDSSL
jgi:DNA-binding transcriptional ArsR family regulator